MSFISNNDNICENERIIEIVSGYSAAGCLKQSNFSHNLIMCLLLELSFGDLTTLDNYNRNVLKELYPNENYFFEEEFNFKKEMEELKKYISKAEKIRVWSSHKSADEFLLFLYICYLFPDKNISVVFSDEYNSNCWSIGCMDFKEVNKLSKKEHLLSKQEIEDYTNKWLEIVKENSELRYIENGNLKNVSIDYFDDTILSYLGNEETKIITLIGKLMANAVIDNNSDSVYCYLINRLIDKGKIKVVRIEDDKKIIKVNKDN